MVSIANQTLEYLRDTKNLAAVDCLFSLLQSHDSHLRYQAAVALSSRTDQKSIDAFLASFDHPMIPNPSEWKSLGYRIKDRVLEILEDPKSTCFKAAVNAIVACELVEGFGALVRCAEQIQIASGSFASQQLLKLAIRLGKSTAKSGKSSLARECLIEKLLQSADSFSEHRNASIIESLLACSLAEDSHILGLIGNTESPLRKLLIRQWKVTKHPESLELLASLIWRNYVPHALQSILFQERTDLAAARALARQLKYGLNDVVVERLQSHGVPLCCQNIHPNEQSLTFEERLWLWTLSSIAGCSWERLFEGIARFLSEDFNQTDRQECRNAIREILKYRQPIAALKSVDEWSRNENKSIERLDAYWPYLARILDRFDEYHESIQHSLTRVLGGFNYSNMLQAIDNCSEENLYRFAIIVSSIDSKWYQGFVSFLRSGNTEEQLRTAIASYYFDHQSDLFECLRSIGDSSSIEVREEVRFTLEHLEKRLSLRGFQ